MTLIETLVVMSIFVSLSIIASAFIIRGFKAITFNSEQATAIANGRKAIEIMSDNMRKARSSEKGDYAVASATPQSLIFYCDYDNDSIAEKITYFLSSSTMKMTATEPGTSNNYTGTSTTVDLAQYVNNQAESIFRFYSSENLETNTINSIRLINIKLKINVTPSRAPQDYYVETDAELRNLKDNL